MENRKVADSHVHSRFSDFERTVKMLDDIQATGVTDASLLALPYWGTAENLYALYVRKVYKKIKLRAFGGLHITDRYSKISPKTQAETLLKLGVDGMKFMFSPDMQKYLGRGLDDPYYDEMFTFLEENNVPINIHLADPETFWGEGKRYDNSYLSKKEMYVQAFRMLDKHPKLRVVFAHFMFLSDFPDETVQVMEKYPNLMLDLTPGGEMYPNFSKRIDFWHEFFEKYSKRIMFGTDSNSIKSINVELENFVYRYLTEKGDYEDRLYATDYQLKGIELSESALKDITYDNFIRFVGEAPKPLNMELFKKCCQRIIDDLDNEPYDECYVKGSELITSFKDDPDQRIAYNFCKKALSEII